MRKKDFLPYVGLSVEILGTDVFGKQKTYVGVLGSVRDGEVFLRGEFKYRKCCDGGIWLRYHDIVEVKEKKE
jgi:hypothetical protein